MLLSCHVSSYGVSNLLLAFEKHRYSNVRNIFSSLFLGCRFLSSSIQRPGLIVLQFLAQWIQSRTRGKKRCLEQWDLQIFHQFYRLVVLVSLYLSSKSFNDSTIRIDSKGIDATQWQNWQIFNISLSPYFVTSYVILYIVEFVTRNLPYLLQ